MPNVGLTIVEDVANGASSYKDPSKRNIGLLGQFVRGAKLTPMKINSLEVQKLSPNESRHHKRMANFMLEAYKDALAKYREVKRHESLQV